MYLGAGLVGSLLSDFVTGLLNPDTPNLGASGAIMGLAGAYLYLFPYTPIRLIWFMWFFVLPRGGITQWQARWVILYFVGWDILNGIILGGGDGGGAFRPSGRVRRRASRAVWLLRMPRDSEDIAEVQATLADMRDVSLLTLQDLGSAHAAAHNRCQADHGLLPPVADLANRCQRGQVLVGACVSTALCYWSRRIPAALAGLLLPLVPADSSAGFSDAVSAARLPAGTAGGE